MVQGEPQPGRDGYGGVLRGGVQTGTADASSSERFPATVPKPVGESGGAVAGFERVGRGEHSGAGLGGKGCYIGVDLASVGTLRRR